MIKSMKTNPLIIVFALLIGFVVGGYTGFRMASTFYMEASYADVTSDMVVELSVLRELRSNSTQNESVINFLESRLDTNILMLDSIDNISESRLSRIRKVLKDVGKYRNQHGVMNSDPEVEKLIQSIIERY